MSTLFIIHPAVCRSNQQVANWAVVRTSMVRNGMVLGCANNRGKYIVNLTQIVKLSHKLSFLEPLLPTNTKTPYEPLPNTKLLLSLSLSLSLSSMSALACRQCFCFLFDMQCNSYCMLVHTDVSFANKIFIKGKQTKQADCLPSNSVKCVHLLYVYGVF